MNENIEKAKVLAEKGKVAAMEQLNKFSDKADAIPFFKGNKTRKLIALGGIIVVLLFLLTWLFSGNKNSGEMSSSNVKAVGNVTAGDRRGAEILNAACKAFLEEKVGKNGLKNYEFKEIAWNEDRAILKANVKIKKEASIVDPADEGMDISGTAVFYLEADDDDVKVVNLEFQ